MSILDIVGTIVPFESVDPLTGSSVKGEPPPGWAWCDGSAVARDRYPDLFALLGLRWGDGDGATTFNLPDVRPTPCVIQLERLH